MSKKAKGANFLTIETQINQITEEDLLEVLREIEAANQTVRKSFKTDVESLSLRAGR